MLPEGGGDESRRGQLESKAPLDRSRARALPPPAARGHLLARTQQLGTHVRVVRVLEGVRDKVRVRVGVRVRVTVKVRANVRVRVKVEGKG